MSAAPRGHLSSELLRGGVVRVLPIGIAGVVIGAFSVLIATSLGALVFSGRLLEHAPVGIALALYSTTVIAAWTAVRSSLPGAISGVQDNSSVILAIIAASVAVGLPADVAADRLVATVVAALIVASIVTGLVLYALGRVRLGRLSRFIPYPVVGGFLAGTGWLLVVGAVDVLTGSPLALAVLLEMIESEAVLRWLPSLVFAVVLVVLVRRWAASVVMLAMIVAAFVVFYAVLAATGTGAEAARADGWLLGGFSSTTWKPFTVAALTGADWTVVARQGANIATLVLIVTVSLLLNATGLEIAVDRDVDLDEELRTTGVANMFAGAGGGLVGYHYVAVTVLADRLGAPRRATGLVAAGVCAVTLFGGISALAYVPVPLVGGLLLFFGIGFLVDWLVDGWSRLTRVDYAVVLAIVATIAVVGLLPGIGLGVVLAVLIFVVRYSRVDVVKQEFTAVTHPSSVDRHPSECQILSAQGSSVLVLELHGFLFFGTANGLVTRLERRLGDASQPALRALVLDFRQVDGIDSSAAFSFVKLVRTTASADVALVLTAVDDEVADQLERGGVFTAGVGLRRFAHLDHGIEWCEEMLLAEAGVAVSDQVHLASSLGVPVAQLEPYLERLRLVAGEVLLRRGDPPRGLYVVEAGRLAAQLDLGNGGAHRLRSARPGAILGEIGMYLNAPASATVVAETNAEVLRLSPEALERLERERPDTAAVLHRHLVRLLAGRLAATDASLGRLLG